MINYCNSFFTCLNLIITIKNKIEFIMILALKHIIVLVTLQRHQKDSMGVKFCDI